MCNYTYFCCCIGASKIFAKQVKTFILSVQYLLLAMAIHTSVSALMRAASHIFAERGRVSAGATKHHRHAAGRTAVHSVTPRQHGRGLAWRSPMS